MTAGVQVVETTYQRLACLADVHANIAALDAVLASDEFGMADAVAFLGCLTTGPEPVVVFERCAELKIPTYFLTGNGERGVIELAEDRLVGEWANGPWVVAHHGAAVLDTIRQWPTGLVIDVAGLGKARLCHGSPRSDIELLTPATDPARILDAVSGTHCDVVVHGHTHLQYQREVAGTRIVGAGSVGLPYTTDGPAAYWTLLGPDIQQVRTSYDVALATQRVTAAGYPDPRFLETVMQPPDPAEIIEDAERRLFSE